MNDDQKMMLAETLRSLETAMWEAAKAVQSIRKLVSTLQASPSEEVAPDEASEATLTGTTEGVPAHAEASGMVPSARAEESSKTMLLPTGAAAAQNPAIEWLEHKGATIVNCGQFTAIDETLSRAALRLGDWLEDLQELEERARKSIARGTAFKIHMGNYTPQRIGRLVEFAKHLETLTLLSNVVYNRNLQTLRGMVPPDPVAQRFFAGRWLEYCVRAKASNVFDRLQLGYALAENVQFQRSDGKTGELDLFYLVDGQPLLIECTTTTRSYYEHISHAQSHADFFRIPYGRVFIVSPALPGLTQTSITRLRGVVSADLGTFPELLEKAAKSPGGLTSLVATASVSLHAVPILRAMLAKASLRPLPDIRRRVLEAVLAVASGATPGALTGNDLEVAAATRLDGEPSKAQINEIINALVRGGGLVDADGAEVLQFSTPFYRLAADTVDGLERHCVQAYAKRFLQSDPEWFDIPENREAFQQVVSAEPPTPSEIEAIRRRLNHV